MSLNRKVFAVVMFTVSTVLYLEISEGKSLARRMLSCSFSERCSLSFIVAVEDERSMMRRDAPHSLILFSISKRVCEAAERTSVRARDTMFSCGRRKTWNAPSGRRSIHSVSEFGGDNV